MKPGSDEFLATVRRVISVAPDVAPDDSMFAVAAVLMCMVKIGELNDENLNTVVDFGPLLTLVNRVNSESLSDVKDNESVECPAARPSWLLLATVTEVLLIENKARVAMFIYGSNYSYRSLLLTDSQRQVDSKTYKAINYEQSDKFFKWNTIKLKDECRKAGLSDAKVSNMTKRALRFQLGLLVTSKYIPVHETTRAMGLGFAGPDMKWIFIHSKFGQDQLKYNTTYITEVVTQADGTKYTEYHVTHALFMGIIWHLIESGVFHKSKVSSFIKNFL